MTHLLDTNVAIEHMRGKNALVVARVAAAPPGSVVVSSVLVGEVRFGADRSANPPAEHAKVTAFLARFVSLPYDDRAAEEYARIRAHLARVGRPIDDADLMIAAIATAHNLTVVTHNTADFGRVLGLRVEDWQVP